jgi:pyrroline-5-carboxylate reductase
MKILVIGGGNMGKTFAQSFLNAKIITKEQLFILEKDRLKVDIFNQYEIGIARYDFDNYISEMDIIILAVKPQDIDTIYSQLKPFLQAEQIIISIMAGIKMKAIQQHLGVSRIIRAMPNLPCQIGKGFTAYVSSESVPDKDLAFIKLLFDTTGFSIMVSKEEKLDAITALSGSGPAYVLYFLDAMIQAGQTLGFDYEEALIIATQTFSGSVDMLTQNNITCKQWIDRVASKGGTTEAALKVFNENDINTNIQKGIFSACERATELSKG